MCVWQVYDHEIWQVYDRMMNSDREKKRIKKEFFYWKESEAGHMDGFDMWPHPWMWPRMCDMWPPPWMWPRMCDMWPPPWMWPRMCDMWPHPWMWPRMCDMWPHPWMWPRMCDMWPHPWMYKKNVVREIQILTPNLSNICASPAFAGWNEVYKPTHIKRPGHPRRQYGP
jgi:hypothetical protein